MLWGRDRRDLAGSSVACEFEPALALFVMAKPVTAASATQMTATTIVIFVKTSPAFVPKALCPPVAPNAPARPPPRPRCRRTMKIKKTLAKANRIEKNRSKNDSL